MRFGLPGSAAGLDGGCLYRVAEILTVAECGEPYMLGGRRTTKRLHLQFGEAKLWYPMSSVSNQPFEELELRSFGQIYRALELPMITAQQVHAKASDIERASNYAYSEADITRKVQEEQRQAAQTGAAVLTTRQKLLAQHGGGSTGGGAAPSDLAAKPMRFERNAFGQAIVHQE